MATTVDTILVKVEADLRDVKRSLSELERTTKKTTENVNKSFTAISTTLRSVFGVVAVAQLARAGNSVIQFASDVQEMRDKSTVVFGEFAGEVRKQLQEFGEEVGRSRFELEGMAASIQDTFVPMGFARGEAAKLSVQLTKLATDVASLNNEADAEVMRAFQSAIVGNHETVRRFGIVIDEGVLKAELFRMGITKNINAVTTQEKVQARLNLILAGSADAFNNARDTANSFANRQRDLQRATDELKLAMGERLLPTATRLVDVLTDVADAAANAAKSQKSLTVRLIEQFPILKHSTLKHYLALAEIYRELPNLIANNNTAIEQNTQKLGSQNKKIEENVKKSILSKDEQLKLQQAIKKLQIENEVLNEIKRTGNEIDGEILKAKRAISDTNAVELEQIAEIIRKNEALRVEIENQTVVMDRVQDATKRFGDSLADNLADGLANGKLALDDFKNIARDFVSELISEFIRLAVVNNIINSIFGLTGSAALPSFNPFDISGRAGRQGPLKQTGKFATGGTVQPRVPTLVGERGPEILIPNGGRVMNSNDTRSALSGGGSVVINQTLNVSTGVQDTVRAELVNFLPVVQAQTVAAVAQARQKGGKFGSIL